MPKVNITFFITNKIPNILLFSSFFKEGCIFSENGKKPFLGPKSLEGKGAFGDENETFLMGNEVLNIFSFNNFFWGGGTFMEKRGKKFWGTRPFFRRGHLTLKMNITFFIKN